MSTLRDTLKFCEEEPGEAPDATIAYLRLQLRYLATRENAVLQRIELAAPGALAELSTIRSEAGAWNQAWTKAVIAHFTARMPQGKVRKPYTRRKQP